MPKKILFITVSYGINRSFEIATLVAECGAIVLWRRVYEISN
jgi:hypothetical protein